MTDGKQLMTGKRGLVMGVANDRSIAWGIAQAVAAQGAELAFTYQGEALGKRVIPLAKSLNCDFVVPCDVTDDASIDSVFAEIGKRWGKMDFLVHAIAFSDKEELKGKYLNTSRGNFALTSRRVLLFLHRRLPARGEADARWRQYARPSPISAPSG